MLQCLTNRFHSLHHTQFRTNYSLFMPFYDYIHGTMDKSTDALYETSLKRQEDFPDVVHLTHLTTPESIFHLQVGFASFASRPQNSKWYMWFMWPLTWWSVMLNFIYGRTFIVERNLFEKLKLQSWVIPRYSIQVKSFLSLFPNLSSDFEHYWLLFTCSIPSNGKDKLSTA